MQRRINPHELDNEALAFKPVLGSMLARIYHNPQNKEENQSRLQKILQFWASKEVYDRDIIYGLEGEMIGGPPSNSFSGPPKELSAVPVDPSAVSGSAILPLTKPTSHLSHRHFMHSMQNSGPKPDDLIVGYIYNYTYALRIHIKETGKFMAVKCLLTGSLHAGLPQSAHHNAMQWQPDRPSSMLSLPEQEQPDKQMSSLAAMPPSLATQQFLPNTVPAGPFLGSMPIPSSVQPGNQQPAMHLPAAAGVGEKLPPYPLFPPGLIPGMVRKMQIGSGVPYSPMSPLDIPTVIPPSNVSPSEILERVSKFFKEIGEVNPSEGPMEPSDSKDEDDEYDEYEREPPVRKGGACIPPPPHLQVVDPETGTYADGSVERKPGSSGSARLGLGATANPNEVSQYDDVYTSYRKQRSTNYHSSMSARAGTR